MASTEIILTLVRDLYNAGIKSRAVQIGILATIAKESGYEPQTEDSYANTSAKRIRSVFPTALASLTDAEIDALKKDDKKFFNKVYGGKFGNDGPNDGWLYRGRGYNQITFKANYKKYGNLTKTDILSSPETLNDPKVASKVNAAYFADRFIGGSKEASLRYGISDINKVKDPMLGLQLAVNANAGFNKDTRGGYAEQKAKDRLAEATALWDKAKDEYAKGLSSGNQPEWNGDGRNDLDGGIAPLLIFGGLFIATFFFALAQKTWK